MAKKKQWIYDKRYATGRAELEEVIAEAGLKGWELAVIEDSGSGYTIWFKQQL